MKKFNIFQRTLLTLLTLLISLPALATWDGEVVVSGSSLQDLQSSTLSFTSGGVEVPVTVKGEDDDGNVILGIGFSGNAAAAGTLNIAGPGGTKAIQTPAALQGQNIYVDTMGPGSASLLRPARVGKAPASLYFPTHRLSGSIGRINLKGPDIATSGTVLPAGVGSERPSLYTDYDIGATGGTLSYAYKLGGGLPGFLDKAGASSNLTIGFSYGSYSDDEDGRFEEPSGGADTGFLITALDPAPNDQTGAFFGDFGIQSWSNIDVEYETFGSFLDWACDRELPGDAFLISRLSVNLTQWDVDFESLDTFEPSFPSADFFNHRVQSVEQDLYDIGFGTTIINPIGPNNRFDVFAGATARLYYSDAQLDSFERFAIGSGEQTRSINTSEDDFSVGLDMELGIGWNVTDNIRLSANIGMKINTPSASISNAVRGDGSNPGSTVLPITGIDYNSETLTTGNIGFTVGLN